MICDVKGYFCAIDGGNGNAVKGYEGFHYQYYQYIFDGGVIRKWQCGVIRSVLDAWFVSCLVRCLYFDRP